jgi:hypothetical protein
VASQPHTATVVGPIPGPTPEQLEEYVFSWRLMLQDIHIGAISKRVTLEDKHRIEAFHV